MHVRIEPKDFVRFIPHDAMQYLDEDDIRSFCMTVNDMRAGKEVSCSVNIHWVKQLQFKKRRITLKNGNTFLLKTIREHRQFVGGIFSINIGPNPANRIYREYVDGPILWNCVKSEHQTFPTSGNEFLRTRFRRYHSDLVNLMIEIYDDYARAFVKAYEEALEKSA